MLDTDTLIFLMDRLALGGLYSMMEWLALVLRTCGT